MVFATENDNRLFELIYKVVNPYRKQHYKHEDVCDRTIDRAYEVFQPRLSEDRMWHELQSEVKRYIVTSLARENRHLDRGRVSLMSELQLEQLRSSEPSAEERLILQEEVEEALRESARTQQAAQKVAAAREERISRASSRVPEKERTRFVAVLTALNKGGQTYRQVIEKLHLSISETLLRKWCNRYGEEYEKMLQDFEAGDCHKVDHKEASYGEVI